MSFPMDEAEFRRTFKIKFREDLKRAGISQRELAARMGKSTSVIGRWAQGKGVPDLYNYWCISQVLKEAAG